MNKVQVWEEKVIIPTYEAGKPDKNPMFLEKRVYQGRSGRIYPHTVIEKISDEKVDKEYTAFFFGERLSESNDAAGAGRQDPESL